jgi:hypothetical protein
MAIVTNTFTTYDDKRKRETFSDLISMLSPEETPFRSMIGKRTITGIHPEWSNDALAEPNAANAVPEGDEYTYGAVTPTSRLGNWAQISRKEWIISETDEAVEKAGQKSENARQKLKKAKELKKDQELILLSNQASFAGSASSPRLLGGLQTWIKSNDNRGAGGVDGGFNSTTGLTTAATAGTKRAFTKAIMDDVQQKVYTSGGSGNVLMVSPYVKTVFSSFMSDPSVAPQRMTTKDRGQATIIGAADSYQGDFMLYDVVPNRVMGKLASTAGVAFVLDPDMLALGVLRDIREDTPARTGDAIKKVLITEYTLLVDNEAAIGAAFDLFGLSSAT